MCGSTFTELIEQLGYNNYQHLFLSHRSLGQEHEFSKGKNVVSHHNETTKSNSDTNFGATPRTLVIGSCETW